MGNNVVEPHVGSASERAPSMFDKVAATVDEQMQKPFARLGFFVGGSPKTTMGLSLFVCPAGCVDVWSICACARVCCACVCAS